MDINELRIPKPFVGEEVIAHVVEVVGGRLRSLLPHASRLLIAADHIGQPGSHGIMRVITRSDDRPDVLFKYEREVVLVEVGTLSKPEKWKGQFPVVHAATGHQIDFIPTDAGEFAALIAEEVRAALAPYRF